jgi:1,4-alpha-glucan branching enzyme
MKMQTTSSENKKTTGSTTQFAFQAPAARQVSLAGDFNNWDPKAGPMHKGLDGVWHLSVALKPGRYEYRFFADEVWCDDPAAQQKAANSLGTENCVRFVAA